MPILKKVYKKFEEPQLYTQSLIWMSSLILIYELIIIFFIGFDHSLWGDERHFYEAILYFKDLDFSKVIDYKEVTTPLVYFIYALWGKLVGFEISSLRILSVFISAGVLLSLHSALWLFFKKNSYAVLGTLLFMLNPYVIGMSLFIYTDMLTVLFVTLLLIGESKNNFVIILLSSCAALLTRQYSILFLIAASFYYLFAYRNNKERRHLFNFAAIVLSTIPLLVLFILWGGISPPSGLEYWVGDNRLNYDLHALTTYITMIPIYTFPLFAFVFWKKKIDLKLFIILILVGLIYFIYEVKASDITLIQTDLTTVGVFHKLLQQIVGSGFFQHLVFYSFFVMGLWFIYNVNFSLVQKIKVGTSDYFLFIELSILFFLLIMPFSYQIWEKYILILLPSVIILLFRFLGDRTTVNNVST